MRPATGRRVGAAVRDLVLTAGAALGVLCVLASVAAFGWGLRPVVFRSGSMAPSIGTGDVAISRKVSAADLRVGDVVTIRTATGSRVTHRIVAITHHAGEAVLRLRGDANDANDAVPYTVSSAYRVWFSIPDAGYVLQWLGDPVGLVLLACYVGTMLFMAFPRPARPTGRHSVATVLIVALLATGAGRAVAGLTRSTQAAWTSDVTASGSVLGTVAVPPAPAFNCGLLGVASVTFGWTAVAGATSYTLHYGNGGASTQTVAGTTATVTALISGGTAWVQVNRDFGSVTWTSAASPTRNYTVAGVSLCA